MAQVEQKSLMKSHVINVPSTSSFFNPPLSISPDFCPWLLGSFSVAKAIEVLLKVKAFVVKKHCDGVEGRKAHGPAQITWCRHGGVGPAWAVAKEQAGF